MITRALARLGRLTTRRPWVVISTWLVLAVVVVGMSSVYGQKLEDSFRVPGLDSQQANDLLAATGSDQAGLTAQVVVTPRDGSFLDSAADRDALADLEARAAQLPHVLSTTDPAGDLAAGTASASLSPDGRVALVRLQYPELAELSPTDLDNLKQFGAAAEAELPLRIEMGGDLYFAFEEAAGGAGELIGIVAALVILFVAFGSLLAAAVPIGMAVIGLAIGVSLMPLLDHAIEIPSYAPVLGAMVGLGVGVDYALFIVSRHRENLGRGMSVPESVGRSLSSAGQPVVFAGGIVVVSILGLAVARVPFMTAGGIAIALVVLVMVAASVTLLPALLTVLGHRIDGRRAGQLARPVSPGWQRWVRHVTRHAGIYAVGVTALLLALAAPVLALRVGIPDDGALPPSYTQRQAYDLVAQGFGPGSNGPFVVAVQLHDDDAAPGRLVAAMRTDPGVASVADPVVDDESGIATITVVPRTGPQDEATAETVDRLRSSVFPDALAGSPADAHIGGQTANFADVGQRVNDRLPWFIGAVLLLSFVLLTLVFRSVLVPLKAIICNLLAVGASFGVLTVIYQWGWGLRFVGLSNPYGTVPIASYVPLIMFAVLFGMSTDYEVFLISQIFQAHAAGEGSHQAVRTGVGTSARVITAAALIMIIVFASFIINGDPVIKEFGVGLSIAILLDATIVRMVIVPATMVLLGEWNWYLPRWLEWLPRMDLPEEGEVAPAEPAPAGGPVPAED